MDYNSLFAVFAPQLAPVIVNAAGIGLTSLIAWGSVQWARATGIKIQQQRRDQLHNGAMTVIQSLLLPLLSSGHVPTGADLQNLIKQAPDLIRSLNPQSSAPVTNEQLIKIAASKATEVIADYLAKKTS